MTTASTPGEDEDLGSPIGDFSAASVLVPAIAWVVAVATVVSLLVWL